jgi:hypothetical protein
MAERKRIYLCLAHMSEEGIEQKYIKEAFDTNWVVPLGPNVNGFEEDNIDPNVDDDVNPNRHLERRFALKSQRTMTNYVTTIAQWCHSIHERQQKLL